MTVEHDDGVFRHLRFAKPGAYCMCFMLTTWPGHLAISGDMGTYVFDRTRDMFTFFRTKPDRNEEYPINPQYWAEKCEAMDTRTGLDGSIRVFDADSLRANAREAWESHFEDDLESEAAKECWEAIQDEVLRSENGYEAYESASNFEHEGFQFHDSWEWNNTTYAFRFLWCLYAITWGVRQYDSATTPAPAETSR